MNSVVLGDSWGLVWDKQALAKDQYPDDPAKWPDPEPGFWSVLNRMGTVESDQVCGGTSHLDQIWWLKQHHRPDPQVDLVVIIQTDPIRDLTCQMTAKQRKHTQQQMSAGWPHDEEAWIVSRHFAKFRRTVQFDYWYTQQLKQYYAVIHTQLTRDWRSPRVLWVGGISPVREDLWPRGTKNWYTLEQNWPHTLGATRTADIWASAWPHTITKQHSREFVLWFWDQLEICRSYGDLAGFGPDPGHPNRSAHNDLAEQLRLAV